MLIIIPFAFLELRPEATKERLKQAQFWLLSHAQRLMATVALLLGAYLAISGLVGLALASCFHPVGGMPLRAAHGEIEGIGELMGPESEFCRFRHGRPQ